MWCLADSLASGLLDSAIQAVIMCAMVGGGLLCWQLIRKGFGLDEDAEREDREAAEKETKPTKPTRSGRNP